MQILAVYGKKIQNRLSQTTLMGEGVSIPIAQVEIISPLDKTRLQEDLSAYLRDAERFGWRTLDFRGTQIQKLPDSIGQLSNLQTLDLRDTQIRELPASIGQLSNLQTLDLCHMRIREMPEWIGQLTHLQTLNLRDCHLKEIPYGVIKLGLPFVIYSRPT